MKLVKWNKGLDTNGNGIGKDFYDFGCTIIIKVFQD